MSETSEGHSARSAPWRTRAGESGTSAGRQTRSRRAAAERGEEVSWPTRSEPGVVKAAPSAGQSWCGSAGLPPWGTGPRCARAAGPGTPPGHRKWPPPSGAEEAKEASRGTSAVETTPKCRHRWPAKSQSAVGIGRKVAASGFIWVVTLVVYWRRGPLCAALQADIGADEQGRELAWRATLRCRRCCGRTGRRATALTRAGRAAASRAAAWRAGPGSRPAKRSSSMVL